MLETSIDGFTCPSDVGDPILPDVRDWIVNGLDYYKHYSTLRQDEDVFMGKANYVANHGPHPPHNTKHHPTAGHSATHRGAIAGYHMIRIAEITDGTSNTFLFGERRYDAEAQIGAANVYSTWRLGGTAGARSAFFHPRHPPNGDPGTWIWAHMSGTSSYHPGGVNFANCDGSVRFLGNGTSTDVIQALLSRAGGEVVSQ